MADMIYDVEFYKQIFVSGYIENRRTRISLRSIQLCASCVFIHAAPTVLYFFEAIHSIFPTTATLSSLSVCNVYMQTYAPITEVCT